MKAKDTVEDGNPKPAFIFSCPSSGASLLRSWLSFHPAIACPSGLDLGPLCRSLEIALESTSAKVSAVSSPAEEKQLVCSEIRTTIDGIMNLYSRSRNTVLWCDSSSRNLPHLDLLRAVFPRSRCICLYRNCLDTVSELIQVNRRRIQEGPEGVQARQAESEAQSMARIWLERTGQVFIFQRRHSADCLAVKYESLTADPSAALNSVASFFGLDEMKELPDAQQPADAQSASDPAILNSIGADMLMKINRLLRSLGYSALQPAW